MSFDGFISYSHAADGRLAPAVQRGLHRLAKPWHRRRALWIFRDQTGLSVTPKLWTSIQEAIDGSRHFVLLASPEAAGSPWVNREIEHWLATKSADRILPVVTDGEWSWDPAARDFTADSTAVPDALRGVFAEEPLYLDLRWARDDVHLSLQHVRFRDAIAQLAAPMHGVSKDELEGEDVRQHRRARRLSAVAAGALVLLTMVASLTGVVAVRNADRANAAVGEARLQQAEAAVQRGTAERATENAERATEESHRQEENARLQEDRAQAAGEETERQQRLARVQRALAEDAAAEAKREQQNAKRYRAAAGREQRAAERQQQAAEEAAADAERHQANARRQEALANQAEARAKEQERIAEQHRARARRADEERRRQEQLARDAEADARRLREETAAQQRLVISRRLIGRARAMIDEDPRKALMLGAAAERLHSDAPTREQLGHLTMATHLLGSISDVTAAVPVAGQAVAAVGADGTVSLWSMRNQVRLSELPGGAAADRTLTVSRDGRRLAVLDGRSAATLWDVSDPARPVRAATLPDAAGVVAVAFSPGGRIIATTNRDKNTVLWDAGGTALATLPAAGPLTFGPDGRTAVTSAAAVTVWNLTDPAHPVKGVQLVAPFGNIPPDAAVEFNPVLPMLAVEANSGASVWLWDLTNPARPEHYHLAGTTEGSVRAMAFSPDGRTLAFTNEDGLTELYAVDDDTWEALSTRIATFATRGIPVRSLSFSPDSRTLLTVDDRQTATLWSVKGRFARDALATIPGPFPGKLTDLAFGPDSRTLLATGQEGTALRWDVTDPAAPARRDPLPLQSGAVVSSALSPDGRTLAVAGTDQRVRLLDPAGPVLATITEAGGAVQAMRFTPDGRTLAVGRRDGGTTLWDLTDRRAPVRAGGTGPGWSTAITFSPDAGVMAVAGGYGLSLWDVTDRSAPARLTVITLPDAIGHPGAVAFSPDGRTLAAGTQNQALVMLWDVADPAHPVPAATRTDHTGRLRFVGFSPDGRTLATASVDNALMLWDVADTGSPVRFATLKSLELESFSVAFSPDGRTLAAGDSYGGAPSKNITLWAATMPAGLAADPGRHACAVAGRGLNRDEWSRYIPELPHRSTC